MKYCPYCGRRVVEIRRFSISCSEDLNVDRKVKEREVFCKSCRTEIKLRTISR